MQKRPAEAGNVSAASSGRWAWSHRSQTVEFISCGPAEEGASRRGTPTNVQFTELQRRAEWLAADVRSLTRRGRQSTRKALSPGHLTALTSSARRRRGPGVSMDDVKQTAVGLLQENYLLPIPFSFLTVFKSKELDDVLAALLLYLSCFFEHKSQENNRRALMAANIISGRQTAAEATARLELAERKLAVCYFSLFMDLVVERHQRTAWYKGPMLSSSAEWRLDACLYSFLCSVAWLAFGRKHLQEIQEEVGRLLYSDAFNAAARRTADGPLAGPNGSLGVGDADPEEAACNGRPAPRMSQRVPAASSTVNQRSPLLASLFPSPKEQSPHLFLGSRARRQSPPRPERGDTEALMEQLNQQLASVSFGIQELSGTLVPRGAQRISRDEAGSGGNNSRDQPGVQGDGSSWSSTVRDFAQTSAPTTAGATRPSE